MIDRFQYLVLMGLCLLITLPLELVFGARVWRRPRLVVRTVLPVLILFTVWDAVAIARDHWSYSPRYTTGWNLPAAVPIEEIVFFVVIPLCALLTYDAFDRHFRGERAAIWERLAQLREARRVRAGSGAER